MRTLMRNVVGTRAEASVAVQTGTLLTNVKCGTFRSVDFVFHRSSGASRRCLGRPLDFAPTLRQHVAPSDCVLTIWRHKVSQGVECVIGSLMQVTQLDLDTCALDFFILVMRGTTSAAHSAWFEHGEKFCTCFAWLAIWNE